MPTITLKSPNGLIQGKLFTKHLFSTPYPFDFPKINLENSPIWHKICLIDMTLERSVQKSKLIPRTGRKKRVAGSLPFGWERKVLNDGKIVYVDHENHRTTFADPRLAFAVETNLEKEVFRQRFDARYGHIYTFDPNKIYYQSNFDKILAPRAFRFFMVSILLLERQSLLDLTVALASRPLEV